MLFTLLKHHNASMLFINTLPFQCLSHFNDRIRNTTLFFLSCHQEERHPRRNTTTCHPHNILQFLQQIFLLTKFISMYIISYNSLWSFWYNQLGPCSIIIFVIIISQSQMLRKFYVLHLQRRLWCRLFFSFLKMSS